MKVCLISIGFMALSVSLSAVLVTVNPDDFAAGTDISTVSPYVTLSSGGGGSGLDGKVYTAVRTASTGNMVFANSRVSSKLWLNSDTNGYYLRADFTIPTNRVSIDIISDAGNDYPSLWVYTTAGAFEKSDPLSPLGPGQVRSFDIKHATADIVYIRAGGLGLIGSTVLLDNLRFEIPEPATFLILLPGLLLFKSRRKQGL